VKETYCPFRHKHCAFQKELEDAQILAVAFLSFAAIPSSRNAVLEIFFWR
jgi:hypothetical protein